MRVLHIINSLNKGGAEGNLYKICKAHKKKYKNKIDLTVITLLENGYYEKKLKKIGIKIISLKLDRKNKITSFLKKIKKIREIINFIDPDIIQTWMYHSNFISLFIQKKYHQRLFWNVRHAELNFKISRKTTILISVICGVFSKFIPKKIIYCSEKSIKFHENHHFYSKIKTKLIYNGYSKNIFFNSNNQRSTFRKKYNLKNTDIVIGYAGRYARQKNIVSMIKAFSNIYKNYNNIYFMMAGKDINNQNKDLNNLILNNKISNRIFLLDEQKNLLEFYNGIDLLLLASHSESFPNVVAESMLCSTPVLSSDAGCAKEIINNNIFILSNNNHISISLRLKKIIKIYIKEKNKWYDLKTRARQQIINNFSIESMADNYIKNWTL